MIQHLDHVSRASAALSLLERCAFRTSISKDKITVTFENNKTMDFLSEEDFMVWLLSEIVKSATYSLAWFKTKII
jgi:hypothetical protein